MKKIYKVFRCSQCKKVVELEITKEGYKGRCKTCKRKIEIKV